jgi:hypothetical protein
LRPEQEHLDDEGDDDALAQEPSGDALTRRLGFQADAAEGRLAGIDGVDDGVRWLGAPVSPARPPFSVQPPVNWL